MEEKTVKIGDYVRIYDGAIAQVVDIIGDEVEIAITVYEQIPINDVEIVEYYE